MAGPRARRGSTAAASAPAAAMAVVAASSPSPAAKAKSTSTSTSSSSSAGEVGMGGALSDLRSRLQGLSWPDQVLVAWFALDAFTHLTIEALYLYFAALVPGGARASKSHLAFVWNEYARADSRWNAPHDPEVMAVELPTVLLMGPGALLCLYAILHKKAWRSLAVIVVCLTEIIGGWYTFAPDWVRSHYGGASSLSTADPYLFWILLAFMNGLWVVVPAIVMYDASVRVVDACASAGVEKAAASAVPPSGPKSHTLIAGLLVAYSVLVPLALLMADRK